MITSLSSISYRYSDFTFKILGKKVVYFANLNQNNEGSYAVSVTGMDRSEIREECVSVYFQIYETSKFVYVFDIGYPLLLVFEPKFAPNISWVLRQNSYELMGIKPKFVPDS